MPSEQTPVYQPHPNVAKQSHIPTFAQYKDMHKKSLEKPAEFWGDIARQFHWEIPPDHNKFFSYNFDIRKGPIFTKWMDGATTNICYNLLDRNILNGHGDKIAYYW